MASLLDFEQIIQDVHNASTHKLQVDVGSITIDTTGLATTTKQDTGNSSLASLDGKTVHIDTGAVVITSSALPSGAATATKQDTGNTSLASIDSKVPANLTVSSTRLLIDGSGVTQPVNQQGRSVVTTSRNDYSSTNVTSGAWVQLVASLSAKVNEIEIFDSSGQTLELGTGGAGSESRLLLVFPGGNGRIDVTIASGTRVSIRAVSATANSGELDINYYN